jgi:peptide/nickel transport system permease protein
MLSYIVRRVLHAILVIFVVSIIVFLLVRLLPGDPIQMLVDRNSMAEMTPEMIEDLRHQKGLDKSIPVQYVYWAGRMLQGDFGVSIMHNFNVGAELKHRIVVTLILGLSSFVIGLVVGPLLGIVSAIRRGKWIDNVVTVFANIGITAPSFWIAIVLMFLFAVRLKWLPLYGWTPPWEDFAMSFKQSILPVFVAALGPVASTARQTRSSVLEVLGEDYVRTAWAKGLNERKVLIKHIVKNSLMPVITLQGTMLRMVLGGSVVVETVFAIPGMGRFMIEGLLSYDYTVVQGVTVVMTILTVLSSLIVDLLYGWVDPRIQYS